MSSSDSPAPFEADAAQSDSSNQNFTDSRTLRLSTREARATVEWKRIELEAQGQATERGNEIYAKTLDRAGKILLGNEKALENLEAARADRDSPDTSPNKQTNNQLAASIEAFRNESDALDKEIAELTQEVTALEDARRLRLESKGGSGRQSSLSASGRKSRGPQ
jgi:hypothetical protein